MKDYFATRKKYAYPDEFLTVCPACKRKKKDEVETLAGFSIHSYAEYTKMEVIEPKRASDYNEDWDTT